MLSRQHNQTPIKPLSTRPKLATSPKSTHHKLQLVLQKESQDKQKLPALAQFKKWIAATLKAVGYTKIGNIPHATSLEITLRMVDETESATLNNQYRHKNAPTNILSFPIGAPQSPNVFSLGDLVICVPLVKAEAVQQKKTFLAHLTHLVIHGTLHLLGYTHNKPRQTKIMEQQEIIILQKLGYKNPYVQQQSNRI
jgi:probable rRNA maturation factor